MLSGFQESLFQELKSPFGYGSVLVGWKGQTELLRSSDAPAHPGPLRPEPDGDLTLSFIQQTYFLVRTTRSVTVYRGYETAGLKAPYGKDDQSFILGLVSTRKPGRPDSRWWTPARPTLAIESLGLSDMHAAEPRARLAVTKKWNRLDYWLEADLRPGTLVYVGRASAQQDEAAYGSGRYGGGDFQFRLIDAPKDTFRWMKRHAAI